MEKVTQVKLPDGSLVEKTVIECHIECHGDCEDPIHIRVHLDPDTKPKPRKKNPDINQMRLDLRFNP